MKVTVEHVIISQRSGTKEHILWVKDGSRGRLWTKHCLPTAAPHDKYTLRSFLAQLTTALAAKQPYAQQKYLETTGLQNIETGNLSETELAPNRDCNTILNWSRESRQTHVTEASHDPKLLSLKL